MRIIDWIAVLGALAWTPHLVGMVKIWLMKSKIRVLTNRVPEIGFTTHGPIFNIRIAFAVENKDIVVSDLRIRLEHESGEERVFEWQGITQHVGKMTTPDAGVMPFEKEQSVLAIKLNQKEIEERFIRFQEASYISSKQKYEERAIKKMSYLKSENKYESEAFLREQEMTELYSFNKHAFPWKQGKYRVSVEIKSPEEFEIVDNEMEFLLNPIDVEELSKNKDFIEDEYRRMLIGAEEDDKDVVWQWRYPTLTTT